MSSTSQIGQGFFRIGRKLSSLGRRMNGPRCPGTITVNGQIITDLIPLGGYCRPGITKAGRASFSGMLEGKKVKVYSAYSANHAKLRVSLEPTELGRQFFPRLIVSDKTHIVEEWIDGLPFKKIDSSLFARASGEIERF